MSVDFSIEELRAEKVWFDAITRRLCVEALGYVNGILLDRIPEGDFESVPPVSSFSFTHEGATVVYHHKDGAETWLPADIWLPDGFTPDA